MENKSRTAGQPGKKAKEKEARENSTCKKNPNRAHKEQHRHSIGNRKMEPQRSKTGGHNNDDNETREGYQSTRL
eukprot:2554269-Heterocapsa_arctica.AAC.1